MPLEALPDELLLHIISYLPSHADAASLSCQCRRMHRICDMFNRRKYRRVKLTDTRDLVVAFKMLRAILKTPRLGQYVRYLELNTSPTLSYGYDVYSYKENWHQMYLRPNDHVRLKQAIHQAGYDSWEEQSMVMNILLQDPATMDYDDSRAPFLAQALAALLASVSPALESLSFCPLGSEPTKLAKIEAEANGRPLPTAHYMFKRFLERAGTRGKDVPFLQNLQKARFLENLDSAVGCPDYEPYDLYGSLNLVRRLPALKSIRVDAITDPENSSVVPPPRSANYTSIAIRNSNLDDHYLVYTIEAAKRLEEFTYAVGGRRSRDGSLRLFSPDHVFRALFQHRDYLQYLDLDVEAETPLLETFDPSLGHFFQDDRPSPRSQPSYQHEWAEELNDLCRQEEVNTALGPLPPCSLRSFPQLKNLRLGIHLLYYFARGIGADQRDDASFSIVDHLPPNLESLCIYAYEKGMKPQVKDLPDNMFDEQLCKLMVERDKKLPRLRYIEGIDELIENAKTVERASLNSNEIWDRDTDDDEWSRYDY